VIKCYEDWDIKISKELAHETAIIVGSKLAQCWWLIILSVITFYNRNAAIQCCFPSLLLVTFSQGKHLSATYFLLRTDPLVTLLVVFETKKVEKDSHVLQFMTNLASELRCMRQFATLRPGHK